MTTVLHTELCTYAEHRDELLRGDEGKFALIRGRNIVGTYVTEMDAIDAGYRQFGNVPFLVKQIVSVEQSETFASSLIGI